MCVKQITEKVGETGKGPSGDRQDNYLICHGMDRGRKDAANPERAKAFSREVHEVRHRVLWNMDETSLSSEDMKQAKFKVLTCKLKKNNAFKKGKGKGRRKPAYRLPETEGHVTVVACGSSSGASTPPYFIIEVINLSYAFRNVKTKERTDHYLCLWCVTRAANSHKTLKPRRRSQPGWQNNRQPSH